GNLERDPGVGFLNINTGEWIDLQLWDTISGKRGREEIYFGAEKASTLKFQTMKDRGYTEGSISLNGGSQDWEAAQENLCDTCLEHVQESICEYMYTDCYENQLVPIRDNYIFFLMGDYAVFTETADLPAKLKFLIFYASEAEYWQQQE
ncbi:MAG TPA: hypothetical protein DCZ20_10585, partial [Lachnospiraceae bacterium]|nr:hypothetical protein [Lachnospiraceae bacterium]